MKVIGIYLSNFGSFWGRHYIPLQDRGLMSVEGRNHDDILWSASNGSGKTTWIDGLDWCLFGEHPRGAAAPSVVNEEARENCCVTVLLIDDEGRLVKVQRFRDWAKRGSGLRLSVNGDEKSWTALDVAETQRRIEKVIGIDRVVFHCSVLFGQEDDFSFADATDGQRKDVLVRIIPELGEVDRLLQIADRLHEEAEAQLANLKVQDLSSQKSVSDLLQLNPESKIQAWEQKRAQSVASLQQSLQLARDRSQTLANQVGSEPFVPAAPQVDDSSVKLAESDVNRAWAYVAEAGQGRTRILTALKLYQDKLRSIQMTGQGECAACGQAITAGHLEAERQRYQSLVDQSLLSLKQEEQGEAAARDKLTQIQNALKVAQDQFSGARQLATSQYTAAREVRLRWESAQQRLNEAAQEAGRWEQQVNMTVAAVNPHIQEHQVWGQRMANAHAEQRQIAVSVAVLESRVARLKFWTHALGTKGLKSIILDGRVGEMSEAANQWVQLLSNGTIWVQFKTQREVGTGSKRRLSDDLSITIIKSNPDGTVLARDFRNWSGGEKYRIARAIDFGLSRLVSRRARSSWDLLILDEAFQHLDSTGKRAMAEMFAGIAKEKSSIFVVDHDVFFQHQFSGKMVVEKKSRRSRILEGMFFGGEVEGHVLANHSAFPD